jgi:hypothetical protein
MLSLAHVRTHTHTHTNTPPSPSTLPTEFDKVCNNMHGFSHIKFGFDSVFTSQVIPKKSFIKFVGLSMQHKFLMNDELYYNI